MVTITIKGTITEDGEIRVTLPENWQPGEVNIEVRVSDVEDKDVAVGEDIPWTEGELDEAFDFQPSTLGEILKDGLIGGWADRGITDSLEWVKEQRRKRRERRGLDWTQ